MSYLAGLHASTLRRSPRQSRILSGPPAAEISARSRSRPASCAVRRRCALTEGPICCTKHRACLWRPVRCQKIVRASFARMPIAATEIGACSERAKQTVGLRASKAAGGALGGRRKSNLRRRCPCIKVERGPVNFSRRLLPNNALQRRWLERRCYIWEVESHSAEVAESDKFRCSGVPFRQAMSLRLEPKFKFIIGAEDSEDLRLRLRVCVGNRRGSIHILR